jgi:predicted PurR-regulated permease PerM
VFAVVVCAMAVAGLVLVWAARYFLLLLFAGVVGGFMLSIPSSWVQRRFRLRRALALAIVLLAVTGILSGIVAFRGPALVAQIGTLQQDLPRAAQQIMTSLNGASWGRWLVSNVMASARSSESLSFAVSGLRGVMSATTFTIAGVILVAFTSLFLASEPDFYLGGLRRMIPVRHRRLLSQCLEGARVRLQSWLFAKVVSMAIVGVMVALGLWLLRVPLPGTLGILAGLLTFIPNLGPVISVLPAALLAFAISPGRGMLTLLLFGLVHFLEGNLVTPLAERTIVTLPPALTLAVQLLLASTTGVPGVAMAAPITAVFLGVFSVLLPPEAPPAASPLGARKGAIGRARRFVRGCGPAQSNVL